MVREGVVAMRYKATAKRWELGWELQVDGVGVTQSRSLATAEKMVREYVAAMLDIDDEYSFDVTVEPHLDGELAAEVEAVHETARRAGEARDKAVAQSRKTVRDLKAAGLSGSDVAVALGISTQRVSQLSA